LRRTPLRVGGHSPLQSDVRGADSYGSAPEKGLRMRGELNVDGEEYVGRTTSRKQFKKGGGGSILDALDDDSDADSGSDGDAAGASDDQLMGACVIQLLRGSWVFFV
jgi:hypothetical protein